MKKTLNLTILLITLISVGAYAQLNKPVKWKVSQEKINEKEIILIFEAQIDKDWHLYDPYNPPGGAMPLVLEFNETSNEKINVVDSITSSRKAIQFYDDIFEKTEHYFDKNVTFKQKIEIKSQEDFVLQVAVTGQACYKTGRCIRIFDEIELEINGLKNK